MTVEQPTADYILDERMPIAEKVEILEWKGENKEIRLSGTSHGCVR
jgi:hypothetical protein